jgi:hypothetical protein
MHGLRVDLTHSLVIIPMHIKSEVCVVQSGMHGGSVRHHWRSVHGCLGIGGAAGSNSDCQAGHAVCVSGVCVCVRCVCEFME